MKGGRQLCCRGGALINVLAFLTALASLLALGWMMLLPLAVTWRLQEQTGFDVSLQSLMLNPFAGRAEVRGLAVDNPSTFRPAKFVHVRSLVVKADATTLWEKKPVFEEVALDLGEVSIVRRGDGRTNAEVFEKLLAPAGVAAKRPFLIKRLHLKLDRISIIEPGAPGQPPVVREIALGVNKTLTQVSDLSLVLTPVEWEALVPLASLFQRLFPGDLGEELGLLLRAEGEKLRQNGKKAGDNLKGLIPALEEKPKS